LYSGCSQLHVLTKRLVRTLTPTRILGLHQSATKQSPYRYLSAGSVNGHRSTKLHAHPTEPSQHPTMLSRYRSPSGVDYPRGLPAARLNNPTSFNEAIRDFPEKDLIRTELRMWDGALAGVVHQAGQFPALQEGPEAGEVPQPPGELAQALSEDLELLAALASTTQQVSYDAFGSESEFAVLPIVLEPRLQAAAAAAGTAAGELGEESSGGGGGGWWSLAEATAAPLTWAEVVGSLGVAPQLAARFQPPLELGSREDFLSHMHERHIRRLAGSDSDPTSPAGALSAAVRLLSGAVHYPV
ncbi:hypothetical protein Agub_g9745, partial [Astrephomene gubernaculifera]